MKDIWSAPRVVVEVVKLDSATTTEGTTVKIDVSNGVKINDATMVTLGRVLKVSEIAENIRVDKFSVTL